MRRLAILLSFVLLLALTGCNGIQSSSTPESMITPAPVPTDGPGRGEILAPGLTADGVTNATRLTRAHRRTLENRSYTRTIRLVSQFRNGSVYRQRQTTVRVDSDGEYRIVTEQSSKLLWPDEGTRTTIWGNDSYYVLRISREDGPNETVVRNQRGIPVVRRFGRALVHVLDEANVTLAGENTTGGTTEYLFTARGISGESIPYAGVLGASRGRIRAVVTESGFIRLVAARATGRYGPTGDPAQVRFTVTYSAIGETTVERPEWATRALANYTKPPTRTTANPLETERIENVTATPEPTPVDG